MNWEIIKHILKGHKWTKWKTLMKNEDGYILQKKECGVCGKIKTIVIKPKGIYRW